MHGVVKKMKHPQPQKKIVKQVVKNTNVMEQEIAIPPMIRMPSIKRHVKQIALLLLQHIHVNIQIIHGVVNKMPIPVLQRMIVKQVVKNIPVILQVLLVVKPIQKTKMLRMYRPVTNHVKCTTETQLNCSILAITMVQLLLLLKNGIYLLHLAILNF
jgi:hypothetical protein